MCKKNIEKTNFESIRAYISFYFNLILLSFFKRVFELYLIYHMRNVSACFLFYGIRKKVNPSIHIKMFFLFLLLAFIKCNEIKRNKSDICSGFTLF